MEKDSAVFSLGYEVIARERPSSIVVPVSQAGLFNPHGDPVWGGRFRQNLMRDDLREWLVAYFEAAYNRDCRTVCGELDFCQDWDDGTWSGDSLILDAVIPVLIEVCQGYGGPAGATRFLRDKFTMLHRLIKAGEHHEAADLLADGSGEDPSDEAASA